MTLKKPLPAVPSRRHFIRGMAAGSAALGLAACGGGGGNGDPAAPGGAASFRHGVASGDPLADRVILWTRVSVPDARPLSVRWEVASDAAFARIVASGEAPADASRDHTVKVDVTGLAAGTVYHYRFRAGEQWSPVGRTKTLPRDPVTRVRLAVFSCANYPAGYFNAYAAAARLEDLDLAVHLGDYIYEYARGGYADAQAPQLGRESLPATETVALADYRLRHAQYRTDPDLQALHAALPMVAVWDDHEVANDSWREGAENHQPDSEGSFAARKAAALQAYLEWMPIRLPDPARPDRIYRSFQFGSLLALHMLDTRLVGRDRQLELTHYLRADGSFDQAAYQAAVGDAQRQLLGAEQAAWLQQQWRDSRTTWDILGQQVLMGRMNLPSPVLFHLMTAGKQGVAMDNYVALLHKQRTAPETLTPVEQAVLAQPSLPYNLDAWDGYPVAREEVLSHARALDKNLVVLAGDTHNAWASNLATAGGAAVGVEFATASVSSPGFEAYLPTVEPAQLAAGLQALVPDLGYCDTSRRGFLVVTATPTECRADWYYVPGIASRSASAVLGKSLKTLPGQGQRRLLPA